jgi:formylglycine-generating enzyme required for sulfatase activity
VASPYQIAVTEVTNAQYAEFLTAVARTANLLNGADPNGLYNTEMGDSALGGITRSGDGMLFDYAYTVKEGFADKPVNFTSFWDAARFANWLQNGQPSGAQSATTTESGAYLLTSAAISANSVTRSVGAQIFLPSEDEWYKAAYYDALSTSYFEFPTRSNLAPACTAPTAAANSANCDAPGTDASDPDVDGLTIVGVYTGSASRYGTLDQGGNVWEWNEAIIGDAFRGLRGGSGDSAENSLDSANRGSTLPTAENAFFGFRVAQVPEPNTGALLALGLLGLACRSRQRTRGIAMIAAALALLAGAPQPALAQVPDAGCDVVASGATLTPAERARMIQLRQQFFGSAYVNPLTGAVDPTVAIASWITVTGYAFALNGHVILLDAYIGDDSGYVPTNDCELSGLRPEFVLIGHGHYDHADLAPTMLNRNRGAIFIGASEHCVDITAALDGLFVPRCIESMPRGAPFGTTIQLPTVIPGVAITAIRHPHSDAQPPDPSDPSPVVLDPAMPKPLNFGPCRMACPPPRPNFVEPNMIEDGAISVLYQFRIGRLR